MIFFPLDPAGLLSRMRCGRTIPGGSLSNCLAFAYMPIWRSFACGTLVDEAADGPYMPRS